MRPIHNDLIARLRCAAPTARDVIEAHAITTGDIKQRKDQWDAADSLTDLDVRVDGGVGLDSTIATLVGSTTGSSQITDLTPGSPYTVALVSWGGTDDPNTEIQRIIARLHPKRTGAAKTVVWWRMRLFNLITGVDYEGAGHFTILPLGDPVTVAATGEAEGDVTFDFSTQPSKIKPKQFQLRRDIDQRSTDLFIGTGDFSTSQAHTVIQITALKADGSAADNVAWIYDNTISTFGTGNVLQGWNFQDDTAGIYLGRLEDIGTLNGVPRVEVQTGTYAASATISFTSGNLLDLGAAPTGSVYLLGLAETPPGTSVTFQIRNDGDTDWVTFTDGQTFSDLGLVATQTRKVRATLTANAAASVTPVLRRLGMEEKTVVDISHVADITDYQCHLDPVTLEGRLTQATLKAQKNGAADFRSTIEDLLSTYDIGSLEFRWYIGDSNLARSKWLLVDSFPVIDDFEPMASEVEVQLLGPNALIVSALPKYDVTGAGTEVPDADLNNVGAWEDQAGGSSNLFGFVDEDPPDDTDYIISPDTPATDWITFRLSDLADPNRDTGHFVDIRYSKSASGGDLIDLTVQLRQGYTNEGSPGTLIMQGTLSNISDEWTENAIALTDAQAQSITDYADLAIRIGANTSSAVAARAARVSWVRFRVTGQRADLEYSNDPVDEVWDDLLSQAEVLGRYKGQGPTETDVVSKTITDSDAIREIGSLVSNFGYSVISSQGQIKAVPCFGSRGTVAFFDKDAITPIRVSPGFRERRPLVSVRWNWSEARQRFDDEVLWSSSPAQQKLGPSRTDARDYRWSEEASKWLYTETLAKEIATRTGEALGTGLMLWKFKSRDAFPEIECGDVIAVETTRFVVKDPHSTRSLRGRLVALATVTDTSRRSGQWTFTAWVQSYLDILAPVSVNTKLFRERDAEFDNLYIAIKAQPGSAAAVEPITKTLLIPASEIFPVKADTFQVGSYTEFVFSLDYAYAHPDTVNRFVLGTLGFVIPVGVTVTEIALRGYRETTSETCFMHFYQVSDTGTATSLASATHDTTGWQTKTATLTEVVTSTEPYWIAVAMKIDAAGTITDARFLWARVTYTMPDYAASY